MIVRYEKPGLTGPLALMWRLESRAFPITHTWAPVSATAAVRCLVYPSSATVTSTVGWEDICVPAVVTEPKTALAGVALLEGLEPLQHFLKWPRFRKPRQTGWAGGLVRGVRGAAVPTAARGLRLAGCGGCNIGRTVLVLHNLCSASRATMFPP